MTNCVFYFDWRNRLKEEVTKDYFLTLLETIEKEEEKFIIYPARVDRFNFTLCPFANIKVVILGQDPYHGPGQAHGNPTIKLGFCFSVPVGIPIPKSLLNIYKELQQDLGQEEFPFPQHGNLESWAEQGVLLLNASLTVRKGEANSHSKLGWIPFTDSIISNVANTLEGVVFLLWGKDAQRKINRIDSVNSF